VSDIGFRAKDGYDLIRQIRARGSTRARLPAIALTAYARSEDRERALRGGVSAAICRNRLDVGQLVRDGHEPDQKRERRPETVMGTALPFGKPCWRSGPSSPGTIYLNHGTVGVTPRRILAVQQAIRDEMERHPAGSSCARCRDRVRPPLPEPPRLRAAADDVAAFLGARGDDLVFVDNITTGVNSILRSFPLREGDEILVSDLVYGGVLRAALFAARERGATVRTGRDAVPLPRRAAGRRVRECGRDRAHAPGDRRAHHGAERARLSRCARTAARLRAQGVAVLADAAHRAGQIPIDIPSLGVDLLHRQPPQVGVDAAQQRHPVGRADRQAELRPAVISWGLDKGFKAEFDMIGTRDPPRTCRRRRPSP
jgi:isopenicillin-N epimerase